MKFGIQDLKRLSTAVRLLSTQEIRALSTMIHRRQPDFCEIIDEVGMDPRCVQAHRFCTLFCALAFKHAEQVDRHRLPGFQGDNFEEVCGFMARGEETQIGITACGYPKRILRHVLTHYSDEDDTAWLCMTISAFLFLVEKSVKESRLQESQKTTPRIEG